MKALTVRKYLITALSFIAVSIYADVASSASLAGNYKCQRADAANTNSYPLSITKTGDTYTLEWSDDKGNPAMYGTGIIDSNASNVLSSSYWNIQNTDIGVLTFTIKSDGSLQGNWLTQSGKNTGTETCTKS